MVYFHVSLPAWPACDFKACFFFFSFFFFLCFTEIGPSRAVSWVLLCDPTASPAQVASLGEPRKLSPRDRPGSQLPKSCGLKSLARVSFSTLTTGKGGRHREGSRKLQGAQGRWPGSARLLSWLHLHQTCSQAVGKQLWVLFLHFPICTWGWHLPLAAGLQKGSAGMITIIL